MHMPCPCYGTPEDPQEQTDPFTLCCVQDNCRTVEALVREGQAKTHLSRHPPNEDTRANNLVEDETARKLIQLFVSAKE